MEKNQTKNKTSVAVIDDHKVVRLGVKAIISMSRDMEFVGELTGGEGAVQFVREKRPDVLLLDVVMPDKDGLDVLREILSVCPEQKVMILSISEAEDDIYTALRLGAKGYLLKSMDTECIVQAIRTVAAGGKFASKAVKAIYSEREAKEGLTPRERELLGYMVAGFSNGEIAKALGLSYESIKVYTKRVFAKLDVHNRVEAVIEALRRGLVRLPR